MDKKNRIETILSFVNNGIYHVNGMSILADNFEIVNDRLIKFYMNVIGYGQPKFTIAMIPLSEVISIEGFKI